MADRKQHLAAPPAPRRPSSGAVRIDERVRFGQAVAAAVEPLGLAVAVVDAQTRRFTLVTEAFAARLRKTVDALVGAPTLLDLVSEEDTAAAEAILVAPPPAPVTLRFGSRGAQPIELDVSVCAFDRERARGRALVIVAREAGARREREDLRQAAEEAASVVRARDEFFSIASHELKTPLTALRLHAQALARALATDTPVLSRVRRACAEVERHAERMSVLTDQLLDVAHIRSGRLELERAPADLAAILREVLARFGAEAASRRCTLALEGDRSVPGHWDPLRLEQIATNLLSNALKYGSGNPVTVRIGATARRARLSVRDRGGGIAEEEQARIFEPFERAARDPGVRGSGLGLWIVRRLVEAHGGAVRVHSVVGEGTEFVVELPRAAPAARRGRGP